MCICNIIFKLQNDTNNCLRDYDICPSGGVSAKHRHGTVFQPNLNKRSVCLTAPLSNNTLSMIHSPMNIN